jgi:hypothetical protein
MRGIYTLYSVNSYALHFSKSMRVRVIFLYFLELGAQITIYDAYG